MRRMLRYYALVLQNKRPAVQVEPCSLALLKISV
jgi:hypothetical protein